MELNKIIAALLVILFIFFSLAVIMTWTVGDALFDADAYVDTLSDADFFETPYQLIRDGQIPGVGGLLLREGPLSILSGADLEAVARELAPPAWLRAQLERALRDLIAVTSEPQVDELPSLVFSLSEVKALALGEPGDRALTMVVENLPECVPGEPSLALNGDVPLCKPPDLDPRPYVNQLRGLLTPLVNRVPDTYQVTWKPEQRGVLEDLQRASQNLEKLRLVMLLLVALNTALLGLIWVLAVRSPAEWLRWTGVPLLLLGLAALLLALLIPRVVVLGLDSSVLWVESALPVPLVASLEIAIRDFVFLLFRPARMVGVILVVVGALLTLVSPLFPGPKWQDADNAIPVGRSGNYSRLG